MQIAITGIGIISSLGVGKMANQKQLLEGVSHIHPAKILPTIHDEWPIGEISLTNAELCEMIPIVNREQVATYQLSRNALVGAVALQEALKDACLSTQQCKSMTLVNGTTVGGMDTTEELYPVWKHGVYDTLNNICVHRANENTRILAKLCNVEHFITISTACSSALNAIITGAMMLRNGDCQSVVVGGVDSMTRVHLNGFGSLGILSHQLCRPFAEDRDGINLGEGAAYIVLEDADSARQRGVKIYGYVGGYANKCDAYHATASSPEGCGAYEAMLEALCMTGLKPQSIPYLNAHGTATINNDDSEMCAIERLFGENIPRVESTKSLTGHTTSASGSIEMFFTFVRMQQCGYHYAMTNAFGFGGNDSSLVVCDAMSGCHLSSLTKQTIKEFPVMTYSKDQESVFMLSMQTRRLTHVMRQVVIAARAALNVAKVEVPDAIVVGTQWGSMVQSFALLNQMHDLNEKNMSPSLFMNAANNALAGIIARLFLCRGYNVTIMGTDDCWTPAFEHAKLLLQQGTIRNVLVCAFDEVADGWQELLQMAKCPAFNVAKAQLLCID